MTLEEILSYPAKVLTQYQRKSYFTEGFISVPELVPDDILKGLQRVQKILWNKAKCNSK